MGGMPLQIAAIEGMAKSEWWQFHEKKILPGHTAPQDLFLDFVNELWIVQASKQKSTMTSPSPDQLALGQLADDMGIAC